MVYFLIGNCVVIKNTFIKNYLFGIFILRNKLRQSEIMRKGTIYRAPTSPGTTKKIDEGDGL
jgi:hypothetical protein